MADPFLVVSPHLDDAVLSCGQFMAGRSDVTVATCLAGVPDPAQVTPYDTSLGFADSSQAMKARRAEDDLAMAVLNATPPAHLGYLDGQYAGGRGLGTWAKLHTELRKLWRKMDYPPIAGPLGLEHPDHQQVAEVMRHLWREADDRGVDAFAYEEMPARVLWPEQVPVQLDRLHALGWTVAPAFIGTGPLPRKVAAMRCYASQLPALRDLGDGAGLTCCYVPERFWRLSCA